MNQLIDPLGALSKQRRPTHSFGAPLRRLAFVPAGGVFIQQPFGADLWMEYSGAWRNLGRLAANLNFSTRWRTTVGVVIVLGDAGGAPRAAAD